MERIAFEELYVPDTSVIVERTLSTLIEKGEIRGKVLIPVEMVRFFEEQAREGRALGFLGLEELARVRDLAERGLAMVEVVEVSRGFKPESLEEIDTLVREFAARAGAKLVTHSELQSLASRAVGVEVLYIKPLIARELWFEKFFDKDTLSVHIKEGVPVRAKKGRPGEWVLVDLSEEPVSREYIERLIEEIVRRARAGKGRIEVERSGSLIVQLEDYRIVIVKPPVSDGYEVTITRPVVKLKLEDYNLPEKLVRRLEERAEGILIAGAPGMGKTTFAQALAEYYSRKGRVVKTIEAPRDMRLPPTVSQYSKAYADPSELHDLLLLSRPDYTVFDEMRNDEDFKLYVDLRLAGIGMIGVVHATTPIDAIQRFIGRVDLGMIPSVIDTVIFIERGTVSKVYDVSMTVKLPTGLREAELARPVVEVRDFLTGELEYEIYTFGEQTVVIPVKKIRKEGVRDKITEIVRRSIPYAEVEVEGDTVVIRVPRMMYSSSIARKARKVEKRLSKYGYSVELKLL